MLLDNKTTCKALVPSALINMNNVINKFLLAGDKFMPEMHLRQPQFVYSACQKEDTINENERGLNFNRGFFFYMDQCYLVYDCKIGSFQFTNGKISTWKSTGIFNYSGDSNMNAVGDASGDLPDVKNDGRMCVYLSRNHFQQNKSNYS